MITQGFAEFKGHRIWYRKAESSTTSGSTTPLLLLHGGPGLGSDYLEPLETLAEQGRAVIRFDQLGSGRSDRPRDLSLWTIQSCVKQIEAIRKELKLDRIHLLGHLWGGMVALEYLFRDYQQRIQSHEVGKFIAKCTRLALEMYGGKMNPLDAAREVFGLNYDPSAMMRQLLAEFLKLRPQSSLVPE